MAKMTSAYANKVLKKLTEDKEYWLKKENDGSTYVAAVDEEPVIPDYDYSTVAAEIEAIDDRIMKIKHAINVNNVTNRIEVGDAGMTIDEILVRMAQLNKRKSFLDTLRKHLRHELIPVFSMRERRLPNTSTSIMIWSL